MADPAKASDRVRCEVIPPNPKHPRETRRKIGAVSAYLGGLHVGRLIFAADDEKVTTTDFLVEPGYEGRGVATALFDNLAAYYSGLPIVESAYDSNTKDGDAFIARLRENGRPYHLPSCKTLEPGCGCYSVPD